MYPKLNGKNSIEKKEWKIAEEMFSVGKLICSALKPAGLDKAGTCWHFGIGIGTRVSGMSAMNLELEAIPRIMGYLFQISFVTNTTF
jgi:hypothetical protein